MSTKEFILNQFKDVVEGRPWYGESVLHSFEKIPLKLLNQEPPGVNHSIAALIRHLISWRTFVIEKINDNKSYDIDIDSPADWDKNLLIRNERERNSLINDYKNSQESILKLITDFKDSSLNSTVPSKNFTFEYMFVGILYHDIYHQGQINSIYSQLM